MATINELNSGTTVTGSDLMPIFSQEFGSAIKISLSTLAAFMASVVPSPTSFTTQIATPVFTGFSEQVIDSPGSVFLVVAAAAVFATGTIILPKNTNAAEGQQIIMYFNNQVNALTINGNGATVVGTPTAIAADAYIVIRFVASTTTWYRVG